MADLVGLFNLLAPFFGLIGLGFACGKLVERPEAGLAWMQFFIIYIALPCLFYRLIADKPLVQLLNWPFILATTLCTYCAFAVSFAAGMWHTRFDMPQSVMQGVAGAYSNIGYMGPPLVLSALGPAASAPVAIIFVFDNLLLFSVVPLLMAIAGVEKRSALAATGDVAWKVVSHPFILATFAGMVASGLKVELPAALDQMMRWLAGAAAPCALFLLGVTVALSSARPSAGRGAGPGGREAPAASAPGLGAPVRRGGLRTGLDLRRRPHGGPAARAEHLRDRDPVRHRGRARLGLRARRDGGLPGHLDGLPLVHPDRPHAARPVPFVRCPSARTAAS
jgi:malonate transporter and related proteins